MEFVAIYVLGGLNQPHGTYSVTLPMELWHQGFLKAQSLVIYCFCYTLIISLPYSQLVMFVCGWLFSLPIYKFNCWPPNPLEWSRHLNHLDRRWPMKFNFSKCKIIQVSTHYTIKVSSPTRCAAYNYLGVCLHHRLPWQPLTEWFYVFVTKQVICYGFCTETLDNIVLVN